MTDLNHPFYLAARKKLRFSIGNSQLTAEQLFDLPLRAKNGKSLNNLFKKLAKAVEEAQQFNLDGKADPHAEESTKLRVVRAVYTTKLEEERLTKIRNLRRAANDHKRELAIKELTKREEADFSKMSDAELLSYL